MTDNTHPNPTGLIEMNGQAVASVSYTRSMANDQARYTLVYRMGNKQVARLKDLTADQLDVAVGTKNADAIHRNGDEKGLLKGKTLHYAEGRDPGAPSTQAAAPQAQATPAESHQAIASAPTYSVIERGQDGKERSVLLVTKSAQEAERVAQENTDERVILDASGKTMAELARSEFGSRALEWKTDPDFHKAWWAEQADLQAGNPSPVKAHENAVSSDRDPNVEPKDETHEAKAARLALQEALRRELQGAFHQVDSKYYHRDAQQRVAFEDREKHLVTGVDADAYVAKSMVKLAEAKGWDAIKVSGTPDFRRAAWMEAQLRGINVSGYKPHETDLAVLAERKEAMLTNAVEHVDRGTGKGLPAAGVAGQAADNAQPETKTDGKLVAHGTANYMNKPDEKPSYYVTYSDAAGNEKTVWGVDLQRAVSEAGPVRGDYVKLQNLGARSVTVEANVRDEDGKIVGVEPKVVNRNEWKVEVDRTRKFKEAAAAFRSASTPEERKEAAIVHPELKNAFGQASALKKYAEVSLPMSQQQQFMQRQIDNIATDIEKGAKISSVKIATDIQPRKEVEASQER